MLIARDYISALAGGPRATPEAVAILAPGCSLAHAELRKAAELKVEALNHRCAAFLPEKIVFTPCDRNDGARC